MRTRDMGWSCRHSSRFMKLLECDCCHACALTWGVTQIGNYLYWALLTLSRDHHFKYKERSGRRHPLEAVLEESWVVALVVIMYDMY